MSKKLLIILTSVLAVGAMAITASAASAAERIWENEAETELAPIGSDFSGVNTTEAVLTGNNGLVITCKASSVAGSILTNAVGGTSLSITSVAFGGKCHDNKSPEEFVRVKVSALPWTATWSAMKTLSLTGIKATLEDSGATCTVSNATSPFNLVWANKKTDSTLTATKAPVAVSGTGCPTAATETVTYSFNVAPDEANNLWMS